MKDIDHVEEEFGGDIICVVNANKYHPIIAPLPDPAPSYIDKMLSDSFYNEREKRNIRIMNKLNEGVFKGFNPGKVSKNNMIRTWKETRKMGIPPIQAISIVIYTGSLILNELASYKVSYSKYIDGYRVDYTKQLENLYLGIINSEILRINRTTPTSITQWYQWYPLSQFKKLPDVLAKDKNLLRSVLKQATSSVYGWYTDTDLVSGGYVQNW